MVVTKLAMAIIGRRRAGTVRFGRKLVRHRGFRLDRCSTAADIEAPSDAGVVGSCAGVGGGGTAAGKSCDCATLRPS